METRKEWSMVLASTASFVSAGLILSVRLELISTNSLANQYGWKNCGSKLHQFVKRDKLMAAVYVHI